VVLAHSGDEARSALGPEIGVVVSDYRMPAMLGTELLAEVGARDASVGRILLTAYADVESLMDAINRGHVHRYVAKPWDPRELRATVRQALETAEAIRARDRLAAETARAYAELRELDAMKTRFLALAAHELRTPVHVLSAVLEMLGGLGLGGDVIELVTTARRQVAWLGRSVEAMTDLTRLASPGARVPAALDLAALVRGVAEDVRPFCARRRLELVVDAPPTCAATGHEVDLHRALLNVALNAIRFTPDGGRVAIGLRLAGDEVEISVADTGIGIPAELMGRMGEPFFTVTPIDHHHSDPIAFRSGGIGLGLAVARAVLRDHGGRLWLASEEGVGTVVHLALPAAGSRSPEACSIDSSGGGRDNAAP
jgi:signal transduction histidine kinase